MQLIFPQIGLYIARMWFTTYDPKPETCLSVETFFFYFLCSNLIHHSVPLMISSYYLMFHLHFFLKKLFNVYLLLREGGRA